MQAEYFPDPPKMFLGKKVTPDLSCSYYLAMPLIESRALTDLLQVKHAVPLLKLLLQNERDEDMKILLQNCCTLLGDYIGIPLVASPITAMTLGFFAYKPGVSVSGLRSDSLRLFQFSSRSLLDRMPPYSNPLCPFWLLKPDGLIRLINESEIALKIESFKMQVSEMADYKPQSDLIHRHEKLRLQHRKRDLEDKVAQLQEDLVEKKTELAHLNKKMRKEPEAVRAPEPEVNIA